MIFLFSHEQCKEHNAEDEESYQLLQAAYSNFLKIMLDNPDSREHPGFVAFM